MARDVRFGLQVVHHPGVEGMRAFGRATEFGMSVTGQGATVGGLEFLCRRTLEILKIEYGALQQCCEKTALCGAVTLDVGEARHRPLQNGGQLLVGDVSVVPIQPVLDGAVRRHIIGWLEAQRVADVPDRHGRLLDDHLVLTPPQIFEVYDHWLHYVR